MVLVVVQYFSVDKMVHIHIEKILILNLTVYRWCTSVYTFTLCFFYKKCVPPCKTSFIAARVTRLQDDAQVLYCMHGDRFIRTVEMHLRSTEDESIGIVLEYCMEERVLVYSRPYYVQFGVFGKKLPLDCTQALPQRNQLICFKLDPKHKSDAYSMSNQKMS